MVILIIQTVLIVVLAFAAARSEHQNGQQQDDIEETLSNGRGIIGCTVQWADDMTKALEDRDNINSTARAAAIDWLDALLEQSKNPGRSNPQVIIDLIEEYRDALARLNDPSSTSRVEYPDITECLRKNDLPLPNEIGDVGSQAIGAFRLVAKASPTSSLSAGPGHPGKWDDTCLHRKVTIRGTDGSDNISGTNGRDVIFAYSGNDLVVGNGGRDRICGRFGGDILNGGDGFDRINGGNGGGVDLCFGERMKKCP